MPETHTEEGSDASTHAARASLYAALAAAFQYPEEGTVADLTDPDAREGLTNAAERLGFTEDVSRMLEAFENTDRSSLQTAHQQLFGLPEEGSYQVVPYEAHYTAGEEIDKQQRRIATVVGLLESFGLEPGETFSERQDHISVELELCQVVAAQRAVALDAGDEQAASRLRDAESTILTQHLQPFVPAFARQLRNATDSDAYRAAATLAENLVAWDQQRHPETTVDPTDLDGPAGVTRDA